MDCEHHITYVGNISYKKVITLMSHGVQIKNSWRLIKTKVNFYNKILILHKNVINIKYDIFENIGNRYL